MSSPRFAKSKLLIGDQGILVLASPRGRSQSRAAGRQRIRFAVHSLKKSDSPKWETTSRISKRTEFGSRDRIRTCDPLINSQLLYR